MRGFRVTDETVPAEPNDAARPSHGASQSEAEGTSDLAGQGEAGSVSLPTSQPVLLRALRFEIIATVALMLVFGAIGYFVSQTPGIIGGALGAFIAGVLSCVTIGSILFANQRFIQSPNFVVIFFGIVAGGWLLKLIVFIVAVVLLRDQSWLDPKILFFGLVAGIVVSLIIDTLVVAKGRLPYVDAPGV